MKSVTRTVAEWLCDAFGDEGEDPKEWTQDARDFLEYLNSHNIKIHRGAKAADADTRIKALWTERQEIDAFAATMGWEAKELHG